MFDSWKIKKLLTQYNETESPEKEAEPVAKLRQYGTAALPYVIEAFQQRRLVPRKAQSLFEKLCDESSLTEILPLISDPYDEVRRVAKELIVARWPRSASPLLVEYLHSQDCYRRGNAVELLCRFQDKSCEASLITLFNGAAPELKICVIKVLAAINGIASRRLIVSALNDDNWQVQLAAVKHIGQMKDPASVKPLIEKLKDNNPQLRKLALDALGAVGDKRAIQSMLELLRDDDMLVRQKATDYLVQIADAGIVPDVIELLKSDDVNVRRCAVEVLRNMRDPMMGPALMKAIKDSDWWVRQIATDSLTLLQGDNNIVNGFIALCEDENENIRRCAMEFFNAVPNPSAFNALAARLQDPDWWVREKAATAIARLKDERAIPLLLQLVHDDATSRVIPRAIAFISGIKALPTLKGFLFSHSPRLKRETIRVLCDMKAMEAVPELKECLADSEEETRVEAARALKELTGQVFQTTAPLAVPGQQGAVFTASTPVSEGSSVTEAILVLDLCNSTDIATRYGDTYALNLLRTLNDITTPIARQYRCQFRKGTGDGFLMTFPSVENAVLFAAETLAEIEKRDAAAQEEVEKINLRFAINFGEAKVDANGDRLGMAVSMTFRVEGVKAEAIIPLAGGMPPEELPPCNRILITENAEKEVRESASFSLRLVGLFELKGITGLHRIFQIKPTAQVLP